MKFLITHRIVVLLIGVIAITTSSCKKFLDQEPPSNITPESYLNEESQLAAYAVGRYTAILPSHANWTFGTFGIDANSDNMTTPTLDNRYLPSLWKVDASGGDWNFGNIFQMNYFLQRVVPAWNQGEISGNPDNIKHYIGEVYFLRAYEYFNKLQSLGDFPILTTTFPDNKEILTAASERKPRTEVARFILSDLDSAINLLKTSAPGGKNQISKHCAYLLKSRVALFEGTWLKYFKGTAFVPNGNGWPGQSKAYNASYQFKSGGIDNEIQFFLGEAMAAAKVVADVIPLVENTGIIESVNNENPYFSMFGAENMSGYSEVLLWRQYNRSLVTHNVPVYAQSSNLTVGLTRGLVESFLMANGLPIYAPRSGYKGDNYISDVRDGRDGRVVLFLKEPGQKNVLVNLDKGTHATKVEPTPRIYLSQYDRYSTGYTIRKGISYDGAQADNGFGYTGSITFRASEAYLNYIEASYEKTGNLNADAAKYWQQLRVRAKVDPDYNKTIAATDMAKESGDWGAYSANQLIDPILYNIRRERRSELMAEGLRYMDLKRWRAMDQLIATPYHIEGFKLWGPMKDWYTSQQLVYGAANPSAIVSDPASSSYLRPHEIRSNSNSYNGVRWTMAHYLSPIAVQHFNITAENGDFATSPIYQNPGWPTQAGQAPIGF